MGSAVTALPAGSAELLDKQHAVEIELLNGDMWLESRDLSALLAGENLGLVGGELIQFGHVEPLGGRRFRLSKLLRGRRGTEWAAGGHVAGEPFVLIESESLLGIDLPLAAIGAEIRMSAQGIGDAAGGPAAELTFQGRALRPPAPVHLRSQRQVNGDFLVTWVRRSRAGWDWLDGGDAPLGEEQESYRLRAVGSASERSVMLNAPSYIYTAAEQAADGAGFKTISVEQIGTFAASRPAIIEVE
jgi:hypothetical protein